MTKSHIFTKPLNLVLLAAVSNFKQKAPEQYQIEVASVKILIESYKNSCLLSFSS